MMWRWKQSCSSERRTSAWPFQKQLRTIGTRRTEASSSARRTFAWLVVDEHGDGRVGLGVRAARGENEELVGTDPERFGLPKYVARHGWVTYYLDLPGRPVDWDEVAELVKESYIIQAPTRLARVLGD